MILVGRLPGASVFGIASRCWPGGDGRANDPGAPVLYRRVAAAMGRAGHRPVRLRQVHGTIAHHASDLTEAPATAGDIVLCKPGDDTVAIVLAADCAPVAVAGGSGAVAIAHAGWRGLLTGVVAAAAAALTEAGDQPVAVVVGPTIGPCCYEFGGDNLEHITAAFGEGVVGSTSWGTPALNLRAGVDVAAWRVGAQVVRHIGGCTGCDRRWFSWRSRAEAGRHLMAVGAGPA